MHVEKVEYVIHWGKHQIQIESIEEPKWQYAYDTMAAYGSFGPNVPKHLL